MKTTQSLFIITALAVSLLTQQANAKIWRVNNNSNYDGSNFFGNNFGGTPTYPVFAQISQAVVMASNGDTIHVEGSTTIYAAATITKQLVIIGTGYLLTANPNTSNSVLESKINRIVFNAGSESSQLIGMSIVNNGNIADQIVYVNVNGVTIKRCRIDNGVEFATSLVDIYILQNYFSNTNVGNPLLTNANEFFIQPTEITFNNNICQKTLLWRNPIINPTTFWPILHCDNNVFDGPANLTTPVPGLNKQYF